MNCCQSNSFADPTGNLVYLNKIYYDNRSTSCPILSTLTTTDDTFTQQLSIGPLNNSCGCGNTGGSCGCGCGNNACNPCNACVVCCNCGGNGSNDFVINESTVFNITNSYVTISSFELGTGATFEAGDVTIDGFPVTDLTEVSGQYVADISGIMDEITRCECTNNAPTCTCRPYDYCNVPCDNNGHFFLAEAPGPWTMFATIVLEGTVTNGARTNSFRLCMRTVQGTGATGITITGASNFAMYCVEIPCQTAGISPTLVFDFDACANLLSPALNVTCTGDVCTISLTGTLVVTPGMHLQVTKPALFSLNANEVPLPCDDIGQCDPCNPAESCCQCQQSQSYQSSCGCDQMESAAPARASATTCTSCNNYTVAACQCCDTNGYTF